MSGAPGYRSSFIELTVADAAEFIRNAASKVEARLHGGQQSEKRQEMIREEIAAEFMKRARYP